MPRITVNLNFVQQPDFTAAEYEPKCARLVQRNHSEAEVIQIITEMWNDDHAIDIAAWEAQQADDTQIEANTTELLKLADEQAAQALLEEAEANHKEDIKKNRKKYIPIMDRMVNTITLDFASPYTISKLEKGAFVDLWYFTHAGFDAAKLSKTKADDDDAMVMVKREGVPTWVSAAAAKDSAVILDQNLDMCQACKYAAT
jgi:hypothetical protein